MTLALRNPDLIRDAWQALGVIPDYEGIAAQAQAEALPCPFCDKVVHPKNWQAHQRRYHADVLGFDETVLQFPTTTPAIKLPKPKYKPFAGFKGWRYDLLEIVDMINLVGRPVDERGIKHIEDDRNWRQVQRMKASGVIKHPKAAPTGCSRNAANAAQ